MWPDQHQFYWSLEHMANEILDSAGVSADTRAHLVGLPVDHSGEVIAEPTHGTFEAEPLAHVLDRANRRLAEQETEAADGLQGGPDDAGEEADREAQAERSRMLALGEALTAASRRGDRTYFVGASEVIGDYRVFPILSVDREAWHDMASLTIPAGAGHDVYGSLPEAIVHTVLSEASHELGRRRPQGLTRSEPGALLDASADSFVAGALRLTGQDLGHGAREAIDQVSTQPYEGRESVGTILLAREGHPQISVDIEFEEPISLRNTRSFRKVLEMAGPGMHLLSDGRSVFGLGHRDEQCDPAGPDCLRAVISGNGVWELWQGATPYLRVENSIAIVPQERLGTEDFARMVNQLFGTDPRRDPQRLWDIASACAKQSQGTMLVVHPDAAAERERLMPQAYAIRPAPLTGRALEAATRIDGAVLVSPDGQCHAVGVILDGTASGTGDAARGARYSSAIRYLAGAGNGAMVIIVSEDGAIDLLPRLMRRIRRSHVERVVGRLVEASAEDVHFETFVRLDRYAQSLEFYLDQEQCDLVNSARERIEAQQWNQEGRRVQTVPISPDPAMNPDYYFLPED